MGTPKTRICLKRKGQFYIFGAIILCVLAYSIYSGYSRVQIPTKNDFKEIYAEFIRESASVIDNAVYNEGNVSAQLSNFTGYFINYARTRNKGFGIFYALVWNDNVYLHNNISISAANSENKNLSVTFTNATTEWTAYVKGEHIENKDGISKIRIVLDGTSYDFNITGRNLELKVLFASEKNNETDIYAYNR